MSIAPFLPGLPMPAATPEGGAPGEAPADDVGAAFGEALAAALAGSLLAPPPQPAPVPASVPGTPVVEVRGAPAPSLEASGLGAPALPSDATGTVPTTQPDVSRLAGARTSTTEEPEVSRAVSAHTSTSGESEEPGLVTVAARPPRPAADADVLPVQNAAPSSVLPTTTPAAASVAPATTPALDLTPATVGRAVVQQVFPEVTHLASTAGNGTHRITLTLQPEQLGEVKVTLVVRDGAVHVRLAGGDGVEGAAVHRALAGGAPELQRLLERTGAEARVSVRDPFAAALPSLTGPAAPAPAAQQVQQVPSTSANAQPGLQTGPDAQPRQDGHAAREQTAHEQPRQHQPRQPAYPADPVPVPATGRLDRTV